MVPDTDEGSCDRGRGMVARQARAKVWATRMVVGAAASAEAGRGEDGRPGPCPAGGQGKQAGCCRGPSQVKQEPLGLKRIAQMAAGSDPQWSLRRRAPDLGFQIRMRVPVTEAEAMFFPHGVVARQARDKVSRLAAREHKQAAARV